MSKDSECPELSDYEYSKSEMNQERGEKVGLNPSPNLSGSPCASVSSAGSVCLKSSRSQF